MAEIASEHWLTRSWRPVLMVILMGFLILAGFVLPLADIATGQTVPFSPRWDMLPAGFWDFLSIGMGGYIGGRSLEKVAGLVVPRPQVPKTPAPALKSKTKLENLARHTIS